MMHGEGQALALRWEEGFLGAVARGPVPRNLNCLKQDSQDLHDLQDYLPRNEHFFPMDASSGPLGPECL